MGGSDQNSVEEIASNTAFGFLFGSVLGGCKSFWASSPQTKTNSIKCKK
jgi:hypothetical protein